MARYSSQEDCRIAKEVLSALENGRTVTHGVTVAAKALGRSPSSCSARFYTRILKRLPRKDQDLVRCARIARRLERETRVQQEEPPLPAPIPEEPVSGLQEQLRTICSINEKLIEQLAEANLRSGSHIDPLSVRLDGKRELVAEIDVSLASGSDRRRIREIPNAYQVLVRLAYACDRVKSTAPGVLTGKIPANHMRQAAALLNACMAWVEKAAGQESASKAV